jgi:hypothetical protein
MIRTFHTILEINQFWWGEGVHSFSDKAVDNVEKISNHTKYLSKVECFCNPDWNSLTNDVLMPRYVKVGFSSGGSASACTYKH